MEGYMPELWAGIDAGKANHHCLLTTKEIVCFPAK
jgi:hypothetical protein